MAKLNPVNALRCCLLAAALFGGAGAAASPLAEAPQGVPAPFGAGHGTAADGSALGAWQQRVEAGLRAKMEAGLAEHGARLETEMETKLERRQAQLEMSMAAKVEKMAAQLRKEMAAKCDQAQDAPIEAGMPGHQIDLAPVDAPAGGSAAEQVL
jgi:hypothetical protein